MPFPIARFRLATAATAIALGACARVPTQSASMAASPEVTVSANQLQLQSFEMGRNLSTIIEQAADSIQLVSTDPMVQRNALLWKISAIPLLQEAALRNDPRIASIDLLAFTVQQSDYLTTGEGRTSFGDQQPIAVAAAATAEQAAMRLVAGSLQSGQLSAASDARIRQWAARHPMQGPELRRASILDSDWEALGFSETSLTAAVGSVDRTLINISYRLSYLNETMAQEARWNAELAAGDALQSHRLDSLLATTTATLRSIGQMTDGTPALLDAQREALMREINQQRILVFQDVTAQREALAEELSQGEPALMAQLREERVAAFLAADSLAQRSIDRTMAQVRQLALEMAGAALVVSLMLLGGGFLLISRWKGRERAA